MTNRYWYDPAKAARLADIAETDAQIETNEETFRTEDIGGGSGGFTPITCNLTATGIDVSTVGTHSLLWSALQDDPWNENTLVSIPTGLGLTFAFDGTDSTLTTTLAGTWAFSLVLFGTAQDADWSGYYSDGLWVSFSRFVGITYQGVQQPVGHVVGVVMTLPSGAQLQPLVQTDSPAAVFQGIDASLIITRLA